MALDKSIQSSISDYLKIAQDKGPPKKKKKKEEKDDDAPDDFVNDVTSMGKLDKETLKKKKKKKKKDDEDEEIPADTAADARGSNLRKGNPYAFE